MQISLMYKLKSTYNTHCPSCGRLLIYRPDPSIYEWHFFCSDCGDWEWSGLINALVEEASDDIEALYNEHGSIPGSLADILSMWGLKQA